MNIPPERAVHLPLHDAALLGFSVNPANGGFLTAVVMVRVNPEELVHPFRELGITSSALCLVFDQCWRIKTNLLGCSAESEVISTFEIDQESGLKQQLLSWGLGTQSMVHFRIQGSAGSELHLVAEGVSIVERE